MKKRKIVIPATTNVKHADYRWLLITLLLTFICAMLFSIISVGILPRLSAEISFLVLILFILIGIVFDMIGNAVLTGSEAPFHSMATRRVKASEQAVWLLRNSEKVANFCLDVIGDVTGIISGSATALLAVQLSFNGSDMFAVSILLTGIVVALTVVGKALGKRIAFSNNNQIVYTIALILYSLGFRKKI